MTRLEVRLLGDIAILRDGRVANLGGAQPRAMVAHLALHAGRTCTYSALAETVWGSAPPRNAARRLQTLASRLRREIGNLDPLAEPTELVVGDGSGYVLQVDPDAVDACRFERLVLDAEAALRAGDAIGCLQDTDAALEAWQGVPFGTLASATLDVEANRLRRLRARLLETRARALVLQGRLDDAIDAASALLSSEPYRESAVAILMQAHYHANRQADALAAYAHLKDALREELGVDPTPALQHMEHAILLHDPALLDEVAIRAGGIYAQWWRRVPARLRFPDGRTLVGRAEELRSLIAASRLAVEGGRRAVLVSGSAGIGKTRLAAEAARSLVGQGAEVLYGRCDEDVGVPHQPFVECLRAYIAASAPVSPAALGPLAAELAALAPEVSSVAPSLPTHELAPATARHRLHDAVAGWLATASRTRPLVLVLDDLQWASHDTLVLLRHLVRADALGGTLLVGLHRPPDDDGPLAQVLGDLRREGSIERLTLEGLTAEEVRQLALHAGHQVSDPTAAALRDATGGNPYLVGALLAEVVQEDGEVDQERLTQQGAVAPGIQEVVRMRAARLEPSAAAFVRAAAVAGPTFDSLVVADAAGLPDGARDRVERAAISSGFVRAEPDRGHHGFVHSLARQAVLATLAADERRDLHLAVARSLLSRYVDDEATVAQLAHHFHEAGPDGDAEQAVHYLARAAGNASRSRAFAEALRLQQRAVEFAEAIPDLDPGRWCRLLVELADHQWRAGDVSFDATARRAATLASELEDGELLARALMRGLRGVLGAQLSDDAEARAMTRRALDLLGDDPTHVHLSAVLRVALASESVQVTDLPGRLQLCSAAVLAARATNDPEVVAMALGARCIAVNHPSTLSQRRADVAELAALRPRLRPSHHALTAAQVSLTVALQEGVSLSELQDLVAWQEEVAKGARLPPLQGLADLSRAMLAGLGGDLETAAATAHAATGLLEHEPELARSGVGALQLMLARDRGDIEAALPGLEAVAAQFDQPPAWQAALAMAHAHAGHLDEARGQLQTLGSRLAELAEGAMWSSTVGMAAEAAVEVGARDVAPVLLALLAPYTDQFITEGGWATFGSIAHHVGRLHLLLDDPVRAADALERAQAVHDRMGAAVWSCRTRLARADVLAATGDAPAARTLVDGVAADATARGWYDLLPAIHRWRD